MLRAATPSALGDDADDGLGARYLDTSLIGVQGYQIPTVVLNQQLPKKMFIFMASDDKRPVADDAGWIYRDNHAVDKLRRHAITEDHQGEWLAAGTAPHSFNGLHS